MLQTYLCTEIKHPQYMITNTQKDGQKKRKKKTGLQKLLKTENVPNLRPSLPFRSLRLIIFIFNVLESLFWISFAHFFRLYIQ